MKTIMKWKWILYIVFLLALPLAYYIFNNILRQTGISIRDNARESLIDAIGVSSLPAWNIHFSMTAGPGGICSIIMLQLSLLVVVVINRKSGLSMCARKYSFAFSRIAVGLMLLALQYCFIHETCNNQIY